MRASVDADAGVSVLGSRKNSSLERETARVLLVLKLIPNFFLEVLAEERSSARREDGESSDFLRSLNVGASFDLLSLSCSSWLSRSSLSWGACSTTKLFLLGNHSLNTVVHILDEVNFRSSESPLV